MNFKNSYWNKQDVEELYQSDNPEQQIIQPIIAEQVISLAPKCILDYGCGDAYLSKLLPDNVNIDLYDKNVKSLKKVYSKLNKSNCTMIENEDNIPNSHYDCVVLSFVLVCINTKEEQYRIIKRLRTTLKENGRLIITNSHPCFLQYNFTAFETDININEFNYFQNGKPYEVSIKQPSNREKITFTDYQWQLSFWVNMAIECGFQLEEMIEISDESYKDIKKNELYPPFLILKFK